MEIRRSRRGRLECESKVGSSAQLWSAQPCSLPRTRVSVSVQLANVPILLDFGWPFFAACTVDNLNAANMPSFQRLNFFMIHPCKGQAISPIELQSHHVQKVGIYHHIGQCSWTQGVATYSRDVSNSTAASGCTLRTARHECC